MPGRHGALLPEPGAVRTEGEVRPFCVCAARMSGQVQTLFSTKEGEKT